MNKSLKPAFIRSIVPYLLATRLVLITLLYLLSDSNPLSFLETLGSRWDGNSYTFIAKNLYVDKGDEAAFIVFPPLYPILIRFFTPIFGSVKITGVVLSNIFFVLGGWVFYKLLRLDFPKKRAFNIVLLISIFPTSYFFSVPYSESLFLFLFSLGFYLMRKQKFIGAGIASGLLTLTKPFGILIWPGVLIEWYRSEDKKPVYLFYFILTVLLAILVYLSINYAVYNDPFAFQKFLKNTWHKSFSPPLQGVISSWIRGVRTPFWDNYKILVGFAEAFTSTAAWLLVPFAFLKKTKIRLSYSLYYLSGVILFTSTSFILSSPRYLLSLPPFFILIDYFLKSRLLRALWIFTSSLLLIYLSQLFAKGQWAF